jgi:acetylornithine deacetylase/succinyl-diaminopimelate desuccinylase-like protein
VSDLATIHDRPVELLQRLIRFDTTNPPGNEATCIGFIRDVLSANGIETAILARDPNRPNLVARLPGSGQAPPLLLQGHVDVVTTRSQAWQHPPFAGDIADGHVWGRGALDMKGGVATMVAAFIRAKANNLPPAGDVILTILADEEAGAVNGAVFLVEKHAHLFAGVRYALGEVGGYPIHIGGQKFYLIQVGEKNGCGMTLTIRGPGGHGSMPLRGGAMARLSRVLKNLDERRQPIHVTTATRQLLETLASSLPNPLDATFRAMLNPELADAAIATLGPDARLFDPLLRNTASPTVVHGGDKSNVIPSAISLELDGRLLPGYTPEDMIAEIRAIVGDDAEIEVGRVAGGAWVEEPDLTLYPVLAQVLREADPSGIPAPYLMSGSTDGRFFAQLGIQHYGFLPLNLPPGFDFFGSLHAADERVPVEALEFGTQALGQVLRRFGEV